MKGFLIKFLLILLGFFVALFILEIGLHLLPEEQWKLSVSRVPTLRQLYQKDDKIGWVLKPEAETNWQGFGEFDVQVKINSHGLRDRERTYEKPPNTFRILLLGDSFTEGIQVPLERSYAAQLEQCLNERYPHPVEVINGGVSGYGTGEELLFFTEKGYKYQPDWVILAIYTGNDFFRDMGRSLADDTIQTFGGYRFRLDSEGHLEKVWLEWASPDYEISALEQFLRRYSNLYYILKGPDSKIRRDLNDIEILEGWFPDPEPQYPASALQPSGLPSYAYDYERGLIRYAANFPHNPHTPQLVQEWWATFQALILELKDKINAQTDSSLAAVIIPTQGQAHAELYYELGQQYLKIYGSLDGTEWDIAAPNQAILRFMIEHEIPTLDLMPDFQAYDQSHEEFLYYRQDLHFNEKGHELTAQFMCDWFTTELAPSSQ